MHMLQTQFTICAGCMSFVLISACKSIVSHCIIIDAQRWMVWLGYYILAWLALKYIL